jgi:hypothetical protein
MKSYIKSPSSEVHPAVYSIGNISREVNGRGVELTTHFGAEAQNLGMFTTALHEGSDGRLKEVTGG